MAGELQTVQTPPPAHTPKYKRLKDIDKAFALRYHAEGLTQVEIAKRLGCHQSSISDWLNQCQDTTTEAGTYLRGQALTIAQKVKAKGSPDALIKVLQGVSVLKDERAAVVNVLVGMPGQAVPVPEMPVMDLTFAPVNAEGERKGEESLGITTGSDNLSSVK